MTSTDSQKENSDEVDFGYVYVDGIIKGAGDAYDFQPESAFVPVLEAMPSTSVPDAIIRLGILTRKITPVENRKPPVQYALSEIDDVSSVVTTEPLFNTIQWFLKQCSDDLGKQRKQQIGNLIESSGLNRVQNYRERSEDSATSIYERVSKERTSSAASSRKKNSNTEIRHNKQEGRNGYQRRRCPKCGKVGGDFSNRGICKVCESGLTEQERWEGEEPGPSY